DLSRPLCPKLRHRPPFLTSYVLPSDPVPLLRRASPTRRSSDPAAGGQQQTGPVRTADEDVRLAVAIEIADVLAVERSQVPAADPAAVLGRDARNPANVEGASRRDQQAGPARTPDVDIASTLPPQ